MIYFYTTINLLLLLIINSTQFIEAGPESVQKDKSGKLTGVDAKEGIYVCTESEDSCDDLAYDWPTKTGEAHLIETTQSGKRFHVTDLVKRLHNDTETIDTIGVNLNKEFQTILGFGGAFTDSATINIKSLSVRMQQKLLENYFGPNGLRYSFGRVPIGGSDFSSRSYSYDDANFMDYELTNWNLTDEDLNYKIPIIKEASRLVKSWGESLKLIASPWSPPTWMKTSRSFKRGHLIDDEKIYKSYAQYLIKFYQAYEELGVKFWGATVQNEPMAAYLPFYFFNSLQMSSDEAIRLIVNHLGPALETIGYTKENFKLMVGDDSLLFIDQQVPRVMEDERVLKYVSGLAFHWYTSGLVAPYSRLTKMVERLKGKIDHVIMTEGCTGSMPFSKHVDLGNWERGESYSSDIIEDMQRETNAWIDWNLALDLSGGPNWARNYVDSPIIVDKKKNQYYRQPMFYHVGHFSRFFRPNSVRVDANLETSNSFEKVKLLAAHNKQTGHLIVNILNNSKSSRKLRLIVKDDPAKQSLVFQVEGKSINTVILKL